MVCHQQGIEHRYGRGFDRLPEDLRSRAEAALICAIAAPELLRALGETIDLLLDTRAKSPEPLPDVDEDLRSLTGPIA
jgi:hypothetical protein